MKRLLHLVLGAAACGLAAQLHAAAPANTNNNFIASPADLKARIPK